MTHWLRGGGGSQEGATRGREPRGRQEGAKRGARGKITSGTEGGEGGKRERGEREAKGGKRRQEGAASYHQVRWPYLPNLPFLSQSFLPPTLPLIAPSPPTPHPSLPSFAFTTTSFPSHPLPSRPFPSLHHSPFPSHHYSSHPSPLNPFSFPFLPPPPPPT